MMHKMGVGRHSTGRYHGNSLQLSQQVLQVELDIGPAVLLRSSSSGPGPSPLSSASSFGSTNCNCSSNSSITIAATAGEVHNYNSILLGKGQGSYLWRQKAEDALWLASAFFILFYGDFRSNFFSLLASDPRIGRTPLFYGTACLLLNCLLLLLFLVTHPHLKRSSAVKKLQEEYIIAAASTVFAFVGLAAFVMLSIALWPVWYILTFPLLFTLFMALVVVSSYALPWGSLADIANNDIWSLANFAFRPQ